VAGRFEARGWMAAPSYDEAETIIVEHLDRIA
jgi:hypothetical protein